MLWTVTGVSDNFLIFWAALVLEALSRLLGPIGFFTTILLCVGVCIVYHNAKWDQPSQNDGVDRLIIIDLWEALSPRKTYLGPTENPKIKTTMRFLKCPLAETVNRGSLSSVWKDSEITFLGSSVWKNFSGLRAMLWKILLLPHQCKISITSQRLTKMIYFLKSITWGKCLWSGELWE